LAASPTSFLLEEPPRQVSASHDKSPPRTRSLAPTGVWAQTHGTSIATDACGGTNPHVMQEQQLSAIQAACPGKNLNAGLTGCAAITSPSSPSLPHAKLSPRHLSTLYDAHKPRLMLRRGKLSKYSGRPRQAQTTRGGGQASRSEQFNPATRRLPRQGTTTWLQCAPTDGDVRQDMPAAKQCISFLFPLVPSPCDYKKERRATVTRVRPS
jgi:hypothetical protein